MKKKRTRYSRDAKAVRLELEGKPGLHPGTVGIVTDGNDIAMGQVKTAFVYRSSLELRSLPETTTIEGHRITHIIWHHKQAATGEIVESTAVARVPEGGNPEQAFNLANKCLKEYHKGQRGHAIKDAHFLTLGDLWKETIPAMLKGGDTATSFAAEKQIITGEAEASSPAVKAAVRRGMRRARRIDNVKVALTVGWHQHGYRDMRGPELVRAVRKATGFSMSIKTVRSLCNSMNLTSDQELVKSGPLPRS